MNPCPAANVQPCPTSDACAFASVVTASTTAESYSNDTDGPNPLNAGGVTTGYEYENDPVFPRTCHVPVLDNDVAANDPDDVVNPNVAPDANTITRALPPPPTTRRPPTDTVAVNDPATKSFRTPSNATPSPHDFTAERAISGLQSHTVNCNRCAQSAPNAKRNAE
ncbi:unannotated protein [freshwater metagenome]|uniref:Unannotated protein n=1 Tax=freshwater metagenome TaxID=449393 RepID=A0A6J6A244_9ZZZZ